jgi:DNA polymerase III delta subunit
MQSSGHSDYAISGMMGVRKKYSDELCAEARRVSLEQLKSSVKILLEADLDMKLARLDPDLVLEFAIVRLCLI